MQSASNLWPHYWSCKIKSLKHVLWKKLRSVWELQEELSHIHTHTHARAHAHRYTVDLHKVPDEHTCTHPRTPHPAWGHFALHSSTSIFHLHNREGAAERRKALHEIIKDPAGMQQHSSRVPIVTYFPQPLLPLCVMSQQAAFHLCEAFLGAEGEDGERKHKNIHSHFSLTFLHRHVKHEEEPENRH